MTAMQRRKGQRGERELFALLSDQLGPVVRRNIDQARLGGPDGLDVPGWAIEVKYQDKIYSAAWWNQTLTQALQIDRRPILFYRKTGNRTWKARVRLIDLVGDRLGSGWSDLETAEISLESACALIRESLGEPSLEHAALRQDAA